MKGSLPYMPKIWSQGSCWGRAGPVVARRARSPSHLSLQNAVWGAGCRTLETTFHLDSILWKNVRLWPRGEVGSSKVPPPKSKVRSCVQEGPAVVPVYPDLQGFWERAGVERVAGEVTEGDLKVGGVGGSSCLLASRQRAAVMTKDERGTSRSVPTARSGRSCPWSHSFCFPGHVVCD